MLPFTKRPGRAAEDGDVFTKDDLNDLAATSQKPVSLAPPSLVPDTPQDRSEDYSDDEVTNFIHSRAIQSIVSDPRNKPSIPPPPGSRRLPSTVPPPASQRPGKFLTGPPARLDEDEYGRTAVRGAPKIVRKAPASAPPSGHGQSGYGLGASAVPQTMSPAAVIAATLQSARAKRASEGGALMPPPPDDLLEDATDRFGGSRSSTQPPSSGAPMPNPYTRPMGMTPVGVTELGAQMFAGVQPVTAPLPAPSSRAPMTGPPVPSHLHGYPSSMPPIPPSGSIPPAPPSYGASYPPAPPSQSGNVPGLANAMPAHFQVQGAPYGDGRIDPPGTAFTARHRTSGRSASAWAMALAAAGLFVGVGAVAVMQSNDSLMDTTASFVDPSRASKAPFAAAPAAEGAQASPTTAVAPTVVVPPSAPADQAQPQPAVAKEPAPAPAPPPAAEPKVAAAPAAPAPRPVYVAPAPKPTVAAAPAPAPKPVSAPKPAVASNDDAPAEKPASTRGAGKGGKPAKGDATDDETKKALEALQKAQLESSFDK